MQELILLQLNCWILEIQEPGNIGTCREFSKYSDLRYDLRSFCNCIGWLGDNFVTVFECIWWQSCDHIGFIGISTLWSHDLGSSIILTWNGWSLLREIGMVQEGALWIRSELFLAGGGKYSGLCNLINIQKEKLNANIQLYFSFFLCLWPPLTYIKMNDFRCCVLLFSLISLLFT